MYRPRKIQITVPCSSSNIGPGFDVLGITLSLYLTLNIQILPKYSNELTNFNEDIKIPRIVEGFSKLITATKVILSWKAQMRKNTQKFYKVLKNGHKQLGNGTHFLPKKMAI